MRVGVDFEERSIRQMTTGTSRNRKLMREKYIRYAKKNVFAICYADERTICYNVEFDFPTRIYVLIANRKKSKVSAPGNSVEPAKGVKEQW